MRLAYAELLLASLLWVACECFGNTLIYGIAGTMAHGALSTIVNAILIAKGN